MSLFETLNERIYEWWARVFEGRARSKFLACLESDLLDAFLELLLRLLSMRLAIDRKFRRNIENFEVSYVFRSKDNSVLTSAEFHRGRMRVRTGAISNPDIEVVFKDNRALKDFLLARNDADRDLIGAIIDNEITYVGNVNYLSKLAYMAKHLMLELQPREARAG
jgi:hypothetical protein